LAFLYFSFLVLNCLFELRTFVFKLLSDLIGHIHSLIMSYQLIIIFLFFFFKEFIFFSNLLFLLEDFFPLELHLLLFFSKLFFLYMQASFMKLCFLQFAYVDHLRLLVVLFLLLLFFETFLIVLLNWQMTLMLLLQL
jgi:hypothetical protein